ncbi:MAG: phenylacetic acid degradation protein [Acidobacteria bacterium]|nr:phenylacetic acid degradation protein [Acidobacteriota bacterium]
MPEEISGEHFERLRAVLDEVPFAQFLGIELVTAKHGSATLRLALRRDLIQNYGLLHGGAMASLIDTATAFAIVSQLTQPEKFTTVDLNVNYLRPITEGSATCTARVIRAGKRILTLAAEVHDDAGNLVAIALSTYIRLAS